jgi:hypothetical protein
VAAWEEITTWIKQRTQLAASINLKEIWAIGVRLQLSRQAQDLALFDLGIDSCALAISSG